jgi:formamidopyrimidine-DNA glycosylase
MPELPEVETTVLALQEKVLNRTFVCIREENEERRLSSLLKKKIREVKRVGKGICFFLSDGHILYIHLRMTGHLLFGKWKRNKNREWESEEKIMQERKNGFLRYIFFLDDGNQIALSDPRKFAKVLILGKKDFEKQKERIGKDALEIEKKDFLKIFQGKKREVKPLLMDQTLISGIGNIYAAEILFKAGIHPKRKVDSLKKEELLKVYKNMKIILRKAIRLKGDSTSDYRLLDGKKGGYQNHHLVYNRKNLSCFVCKNRIKREVIGGRGSYYCSSCQK